MGGSAMRPRVWTGLGLLLIGGILVLLAVKPYLRNNPVSPPINSSIAETSNLKNGSSNASSINSNQPNSSNEQIRGTVSDVDGSKAIAGAVVRASSTTSSDIFEATTTDDGSFALSSLPVGQYSISCKAALPYLPTTSKQKTLVTITQRGPPIDINLRLSRGIVVYGKVIFEDGSPASFANVTGRQSSTQSLLKEYPATASLSDDNGQFEIGPFEANTTVTLMAQLENASSAWTGPLGMQADTTTQEVRGVVLKLQPGGRIEGTARTTSSHVLVHARIEANDQSIGKYETTTDGDGRYSLGGLPAGQYSLRAIPGDLQSTNAPDTKQVKIAAGEVLTGIDIVFDDGDRLTITGNVTTDTHEPIADALITAINGESELAVATHEDGAYTIPYLRQGVYELTAQHPNFMSAQKEAQSNSVGINFILKPLSEITLRVQDEFTKAPIPNFNVVFSGFGDLFKHQSQVFDPNGTYRIDLSELFADRLVALKTGTEATLNLTVEAADYLPNSQSLSYSESSSTHPEVLMLLKKGKNTLSGAVVDEQNNPIAGAEVFAGNVAMLGGKKATFLIKTNVDGKFRVEHFAEKIEVASARHPEFGPSSAWVSDLNAIRIVLRKAGTIAGTVRVNGQLKSGVQVLTRDYSDGSPTFEQTTTDTEGKYVFRALPSGKRQVGVANQWKTARVLPGDQVLVHFDIDLEGLSQIQGIVTLKGEPVEGTNVVLVMGEQGNLAQNHSFSHGTVTNSDGFYSFANIPAGSGWLVAKLTSVISQHELSKRCAVTVGRKERVNLNIEMESGYSLTGKLEGNYQFGTVLLFNGNFNVDEWIGDISNITPEKISDTFFDPYGAGQKSVSYRNQAFSFSNLDPGLYTLAVLVFIEGLSDPTQYHITSRTVDVTANGENFVLIKLQ